jgi:hypothetical protein
MKAKEKENVKGINLSWIVKISMTRELRGFSYI